MRFKLKLGVWGMGAALFGAALPPAAFASQHGNEGETRLDVGFLVEGGEINTQAKPVERRDQGFQEGSVMAAEDVLGALRAEPAADLPRGKFLNATLLVFVESGDGKIASKEKIAFCYQLDLYSEPQDPSLMKASCDTAVFEYAVSGSGISFLRNGQEVGAFPLESGFYLINGAISRIPALQ